MNRLNRALVALSVCAGFAVAASVHAQQTTPPTTPPREPLKPILSGKFVPPISGLAEVQNTPPKVSRKGKQVVTTIQVKNISKAPIAGFKCTETWYDKQRNLVPGAGDIYVHKGMFQPNEIITVTLVDDYDASRMDANQYVFSHARGDIHPSKVTKF